MTELWTRVAIAVGVMLLTALVAWLIDRRLLRSDLSASAQTRYRVLRRTVVSAVVFVGVLSALLVIPQVRAVATGILASSAVIGIVLGFAAQRTLGNFIAGLLIAFAQPVRLGDEVVVAGTRGVVEEIGLTYTWVRADDDDRLVIPNEKLASEAIRNSTIRSPRARAEVTVQVPLSVDLRRLVAALGGDGAEAYVSALSRDDATIAVRAWVDGDVRLDRIESDMRLTVHDRLRQLGIAGAG